MSEPTEIQEVQTADRAQRRRGRPPGSTARKRRHVMPGSLDFEPQAFLIPHKLATRYQDAVKTYEKVGLTQRTMQILRRIAGSRTFALETQRGPVLQQLLDVSKLLFLTELELVVWDLYLANTQWAGLPVSLQTLLVASGYSIKSLMSSADTSYISTCLAKQIPQFQTGLNLWTAYCGSHFSITPKVLLTRYHELVTPAKETEASPVNYNFYVDEIIHLKVAEDQTYLQTLQDYSFAPMPEPVLVPISPAKPMARYLAPIDNLYREEGLFSPLLPVEDFGALTPMLIPYSFAYYSPPQSALPMLEDLGSAFLGPPTEN